jgi:flavin reductase (DIM6/NTAB) family NADH-FMN oxidoreductase RutF
MMSGFPTGVSVVTTTDVDGDPRGMTCSSICSVTLAPPTLLVCLRAESPTLQAILRVGAFAVNLLHDDGLAIAQLFSSGSADRFDFATWRPGPGTGLPHLVHDAHVIADCRVTRTERVGDHLVVFGQPSHIAEHGTQPPLLYGLRQYRSWPVR